ncbi:proline--tRNA ligase [Candidatus Pacearchaeota archaeon]|nr:proline--tRNA ligase [Candidatus Pacearchaeota archaeon]
MVKKSEEGLTVKKEDDFTEWFIQLMTKAELADYSPVSGFIVYRPYAFEIWERMKEAVDKEFKKLGVKNAYFPMLFPESLFEKEKEHVAGFAPEVAWVTEVGNKKLSERLAIRPTSEVIMYYFYSKWIRSHRDLPLIINQWNNVVRWDTNNPVPFFRGREFLWNELHTAFATEKECLKHGLNVIKAYDKVTEELMAVPAIYGRKTEKEKFAGAVFTEKNHVYLPNGKVLEGTCNHYDGQNFAKAYDIKFKDSDGKENYVYQNTHAISTRLLGGMLGMHSDNNGLVLPPRIAPNKVVIIPLLFKGKEKEVLEVAKNIEKDLKSFDPLLDDRDYVTPGRKFGEWELKGIPLRIELGPRDLEKKQVVVSNRVSGEKIEIKIKDLKNKIPVILEEMQKELYARAKKLLDESMVKAETKKDLKKFLDAKKMVSIPMCDGFACEDLMKSENSGAKTLFIDEKNSAKGKKCLYCGKNANYWVYVGKTY